MTSLPTKLQAYHILCFEFKCFTIGFSSITKNKVIPTDGLGSHAKKTAEFHDCTAGTDTNNY